jgi:hypothetical protein
MSRISFNINYVWRTDIPPEKKAKILSQIKAVSDRWRPFLQEATAAIEGDANKPQK